MQRTESDAAYFLRRAREEARFALTADKPEVAAAHRGLSLQYSERLKKGQCGAGGVERTAALTRDVATARS